MLPYPSTGAALFQNLTIQVCRKCGLGFVVDDIAKADLDIYYKDEYGLRNKRDRKPEPQEYFSDVRHHFKPKRSISQVKLAKQYYAGNGVGSVLDFGAGPGTTLYYVRENWPDAALTAIEPDPVSWPYLDQIKARRIGSLTELPAKSFDLVFTSHTLEHVTFAELEDVLTEFRRILRPGGLIVGEVPNADFRRFVLDTRPHDPHLLFFTKESCRSILRHCGFQVPFLQTYGHFQERLREFPGRLLSRIESRIRGQEYSWQGRVAIRFIATMEGD